MSKIPPTDDILTDMIFNSQVRIDELEDKVELITKTLGILVSNVDRVVDIIEPPEAQLVKTPGDFRKEVTDWADSVVSAKEAIKMDVFDNWGVLEWIITHGDGTGTDVTNKISEISVCMPDDTNKWFRVIWEKKRKIVIDHGKSSNVNYYMAYVVYDLNGYEVHINLKRMIKEVKIVGWR